MSVDPISTVATSYPLGHTRKPTAGNSLVLLVQDNQETLCDMKHVLELNGYRVMDSDNGQAAIKQARYAHPDLLLVDLDVPLLYELVAARQIIKNSRLGLPPVIPVVIVSHEREFDSGPMMEVSLRRNEYVTRLSDYDQLSHLLDYLLPIAWN
jgi:two-component system, OmpR family, KDP operon response regulator KdpE